VSGHIPRAARSLPGLWPTREQFLVLQAALLPAEPARAAFEEWLKLIDLDDDFDPGTFRLLPMMYFNLREHGVVHPLMSRLKGVYRLTWYKNNKLFSDMGPVVKALHGAGIPIMLLKGVPLAQSYYRNVGLRPMADIDVLVPTSHAETAIEVMASFPYSRYAEPSPDFLKYRHAMQYKSAAQGEMDLHWHALCECHQKGADDFFWAKARPFLFNGVPCEIPDSTRMLFHTVIHGFRWNEDPPIRWVADAMVILRESGREIDWDALVQHAGEHGLGYRLRLGLGFLRECFFAPIPISVLSRLKHQGVSLVQRIENTYVLRDPAFLRSSPLGHLWIVFSDYCRFARKAKPIAFAVGFTHYLRFRWNLRGRSEIAGYISRGILKRIARLFQPAGAQVAEHRSNVDFGK